MPSTYIRPSLVLTAVALAITTLVVVEHASRAVARGLHWPTTLSDHGGVVVFLGNDWSVVRNRTWFGEATVIQWGWQMAQVHPPRGREQIPAIPARQQVLQLMDKHEGAGRIMQRASGVPFRSHITRIGPDGQQTEMPLRRSIAANFGVMLLLALPATLAASNAGARTIRQVIRRRRRQRGQCPACGYDRTGLSRPSSCPECGAATAHG